MIGNDDGIRKNRHGLAIGTVFPDQHSGVPGAVQVGGYLNQHLLAQTGFDGSRPGLSGLAAFYN